MNTGIRLYDYQQNMRERIERDFQSHRSVMAQMPTGTGKTYLLAAVVLDYIEKTGRQVWIVAHRRELVDQINNTISKWGDNLIDLDNAKELENDTPVRVFSIQWLQRHIDEIRHTPGLVVIDEAHHALAKTYKLLWTHLPEAKFLGLTATPYRLNGKGFTDLFDVLVRSWSMIDFIKKGYLSTYDYISISADSVWQKKINQLHKRGTDGDYQIKEMDAMFNRSVDIENLYRSAATFAEGRKGIVFAINIDHAWNIAKYYKHMGLDAIAIDSHTPAKEREDDIQRFRDGELDVLVNVGIFDEGFDVADVGFIQLARPTLSLAKYLQMVGRGMRVAKDKENCIIIDNAGLYLHFGLPSQDWNWDDMFKGQWEGLAQKDSAYRGLYLKSKDDESDKTLGMVNVVGHDNLVDFQTDKTDIQTGIRLFAELSKQRQNVSSQKKDPLKEEREKLLNGDYGETERYGKEIVILKNKQGQEQYVDLVNLNRISRKKDEYLGPRIVGRKGLELVKYGDRYYTRTLKPYTSMRMEHISEDNWHGFYLTIPGKGYSEGWRSQQGNRCVIKGDNSETYTLVEVMRNGSIVVRDSKQRCYKVSARGGKEYIGHEVPNSWGEKRYEF